MAVTLVTRLIRQRLSAQGSERRISTRSLNTVTQWCSYAENLCRQRTDLRSEIEAASDPPVIVADRAKISLELMIGL